MWQAQPDDRMILVHVAEHPGAVRVQMTVGTRMPRFVGASGRCLAAFSGLSRTEMKTRFAALRWDRAPSFEAYWKSLQQVRELGFARDDGHYQRGATVLAVPVFDASGQPTMTIGCASFSEQMDTSRTRALVKDLQALAQRLSRSQGRA
jgi:DNA-binding IclR family transcriptional regulator